MKKFFFVYSLTILFCSYPSPSNLQAHDAESIYPRSTGIILANKKMMIEGGEDKELELPVPFYVIKHPKGLVLFDTGFGSAFIDQVNAWWFNRFMQVFLPYRFQPDTESATTQLKAIGYQPEDVTHLILSHMHLDHAGGILDFPKAKTLISQEEWDHAQGSRVTTRLRGYLKEQYQDITARVKIIDYPPASDKNLDPFDRAYDVFSDDSLLIIPTPGHTPGHQSLQIKLASGKKVLLTGDAVWLAEGYQKPLPKSWLVQHLEEDQNRAWNTTQRIHAYSQKHPEVMIIPGHDPDVFSKLPQEIK